MKSQAWVPLRIGSAEDRVRSLLVPHAIAVGSLCALSQLAVPLPFTPVPITGQTFGVASVALLWGRTRSVAAFSNYLLLGVAGLPVLASGAAWSGLGPTTGYLAGMLAACWVVGGIADRGWNRGFLRNWLAACLGSALILAFGLAGLAFFVPAEKLLLAGLLPFLPGDLIKNVSAALIVSRLRK